MVGSTTLTIRLDLETKRSLEQLASILGVNLSDLLRYYIVPFARSATMLQALKTIRELERAVLKAIIGSEEFQELLKELKKKMVEQEFCGGYNCEYRHTYKVIPDSFLTIVEVDKILWPARLERYFDDGSIAYERWEIEKVETVKELAEWLKDLEDTLTFRLRKKIEEIKEAVRWLLS